jgi:hypothetical protein
MATRSTIALEFADGTIGQVYCHWDGYISNNGKILLNNYMDPFKLRELIDLGQVSSLGAEIGVKHPFDNPAMFGTPEYQAYKDQYGDMTKFYGRDRGEEGVGAHYFKDFADYEQNHQYEEYEYILRTDGVWYVNQGNGYEPLMEAYIEVLRQANEEEETV